MPGVAPDVVAFDIVTGVPLPRPGLTPFGSYVIGLAPTSVPRTIGFAGSRVSATVVRVTRPLKAWFLDTLSEPTAEVNPVLGSETVPGEPTAKSGIDITSPG